MCILQEGDAGYEEISSEDEFIELDGGDLVCTSCHSRQNNKMVNLFKN